MKKDEQHRDKERVQFLGVRRAWVGIALFMFCILISVYSSMAISYHLSKGWNGYETVRAIVVDTTTAIPTAAAIPVMVLFLGVEVPMILYPMVKDWIEERQQKREAHGRELADREWVEWDGRRKAAEAAGENFTEPNPAEKRNDAPQDK
ncbi:hypothetical protein C6495_03210 [Candidatus Poribacteria bacterium]|nr:MAG: hypothetical protein C6495_03210 [Candidatus Poribacteria bacterium]